MLAVPVDQEGDDDAEAETERHGEADAHLGGEGEAGRWRRRVCDSESRGVEGGLGESGVGRETGLVEVERRGCANGGVGRCDGQAVDGEASRDRSVCACARGMVFGGSYFCSGSTYWVPVGQAEKVYP